MQSSMINYLDKPKMKDPVLIEGLPGIGNVGRAAAGYLVSELKAKKFAELFSPQFLPLVAVQKNGVAKMLKAEFYHYKAKDNDFIILIGDSQSVSLQGYYDICGCIMGVAREFGVKRIVTLGGIGVENIPKEPRIIGAVSDEKYLDKYRKYGIVFDGAVVGTVIGASGLLLGLAQMEGVEGICLMAETIGFPIVITDPMGADAMLKMLMRLFDFKLDLTSLEKEIKEIEDRIRKTEEMHKKMMSAMGSDDKKEDTSYIG